MQGQVEGHPVQGNAKLSTIHPVHEGEDEDPTREEAQKDHDPVEFVQPGVVKTQLDVRWVSSGGRKKSGGERKQYRTKC